MAQPNKKLPARTVDISCAKCNAAIFKYHKGGKGALVKCFIERIAENYTEQACHCPGCGQAFARETLIRGAPAYKIIGGKVRMK
ncbi:hypothetical protein L9G15_02035 [Shewanella sp. A3A]|nr:hypothetical protein [Shewanella ferrihydritica]